MFHRIGFSASHDDTIGDNQPDEDRQVLADGERIGFDELIGDDLDIDFGDEEIMVICTMMRMLLGI